MSKGSWQIAVKSEANATGLPPILDAAHQMIVGTGH
jgi:hypothetical protein